MPARSTLSTLVWLVRTAWPFRRWIALAVLLGALTVGSGIGLMATSAYIIAAAALHPSFAELAVPVVGVRFFGILRGVCRYLERLVSHHVNFSLLAHLRVWFYTALEPLAPARIVQYRSGDLLSRIVADIEVLQDLYVRLLAPPLVAAVVAVGMAAFLAAFSPALAGIVLAFMLLVGVLLPLAALVLSRDINRKLVSTRAAMSVRLADGIQGLADILALGRENDVATRIGESSRELVRAQGRTVSLTALHDALSGLLTHLAMWSVIVTAVPLITLGRLDAVYLPVLALAVLASFEAVTALPPAFQYLTRSLQSADRLLEVVAKPEPAQAQYVAGARSDTTRAPSSPRNRPEGAPAFARTMAGGSQSDDRRCGIDFRHVSFAYGPRARALEDVDFRVDRGRMLALVGPSGSGKTTILNLLLGFWDTYAGEIVVGGHDVRVSPDRARDLVGVVSQRTHLFNTSVRANLLLARPGATDDQLIAAAEAAHAHDLICSLPDGYDTIVGEQGTRLSGGERQRLAFARALLKDAPILLLDEATANLDPRTERQALDAIHAQATSRSVVIATHRLVGMEAMSEILVLAGGRIVERGTHVELLQCRGLYRRMWDLQNQFLPREFGD